MSDEKAPVAAAVETVKQQDTATQDPKLDQYARKEKELMRRKREIDAQLASERTKWQQQEQEYKTNYIPKSRLSEDPLSVLNDAGVSYEKLTELILQQPNQNDPTIRALKSEIEALKNKYNEGEKKQQEQITQQYQQAMKQIGTEVKLLVDGDAEYETIKETGMYDAVSELIEQTYQSEGYLMDISEAAKEVENYLVEEAMKMSQLKKVQSRSKPADTPQAQASASNTQSQIKTLTNAQAKPTVTRTSEKERRERALAAFHGKLNQ